MNMIIRAEKDGNVQPMFINGQMLGSHGAHLMLWALLTPPKQEDLGKLKEVSLQEAGIIS